MDRAWKRNEVAVSPVIATILLVAITVVLAAVLYVMVTSLIDGGGDGQGYIELTKESVGPHTWELEVVGASQVDDLTDYKVVILKDGTRIHTIDPLKENNTGDYRFTDLDGGGELSRGDRFYVTCEPGSNYELSVIWRQTGDSRGSVKWET